MKVNFDREERYCEVIREEGDPSSMLEWIATLNN